MRTGSKADIGRVIIVVGGARGIGLATGQALATSGMTAVLADRDAFETAERDGFDCRHVDIKDRRSVDGLVAAVLEAHGRVDGLVNAAGYNRHAAIDAVEDDVWEQLFDVHLGGVIRLCRASADALKASRGSVVNFSSIGARVGRPNRAPYAAAKAGVEALTRTLAIEWAPFGIRVNAIVPGIVNTRLVRDNIDRGLVDRDSLVRFIPMKRMGEPEELAAAVEFLVSSKSSYITGQSLVVDGGALANGAW